MPRPSRGNHCVVTNGLFSSVVKEPMICGETVVQREGTWGEIEGTVRAGCSR
jgi:hypothetical protein